jgi:parallel beta-helix repeat protein
MCGCSGSHADHLGKGIRRFALRSGLRGTRHDCFQSGRFCYVGTRQNVAYGSVYPDRPCSAAGRRRAGLLEIQNSTASTVESFYADNNGFGLLLEGSSNITVLGGTIANNTASGIELNEGSSNTLNGIVLDDRNLWSVARWLRCQHRQ